MTTYGDRVYCAWRDKGVMATGIAFPTVPEGKARIRCIMTSEHTRDQIDTALETLTTTARASGIL